MEAAKAIAEWNADEHKTDPNELKAKFAAIKQGKNYDVKPCKWGAACKYKWKCRGSHPVSGDEEIDAEHRRKMKKLTHLSREITRDSTSVVSQDDLTDAINQGFQKLQQQQKSAGASKTNGISISANSSRSPATNKKRKLHVDDEFLNEVADEQEQADDAEEQSEPDTPSSMDEYDEEPDEPDLNVEEQEQPSDHVEQKEEEQKSEQSSRAATSPSKHDASSSSSTAASTSTSNSISATSNTTAASFTDTSDSNTSSTTSPTAADFPPIDLSKHDSVESLSTYSGDHLKAELKRLGLKCGGSPQQKMERLWLLKTHTREQLPKKVLA